MFDLFVNVDLISYVDFKGTMMRCLGDIQEMNVNNYRSKISKMFFCQTIDSAPIVGLNVNRPGFI